MIYISTSHFYDMYHGAKRTNRIAYKANHNESEFRIPYDIGRCGTRLVIKALHKNGRVDSCIDYLEYPDGETELVELNIESKDAMQKLLDEFLEKECVIF